MSRMSAWKRDTTISGLEANLDTDDKTLDIYSRDFGGVVTARPGAVLHAANAQEVAKALKFCSEHRIPVVARAFGQSGHGQALHEDALVIDLTRLDSVDDVNAERIVIGGGASWAKLLETCGPQGFTAPVYTNHLDVSIGGSLSFGGFGAQSHRYGAQADNIEFLEVARVSGEVETCSASQNPELFYAALAGLGQFGIITRASIQPIPAPREVAIVHLGYTDLDSTIDDACRLAGQNRFDSIDNYVIPGSPSPHMHVNELGFYVYGDDPVPDLAPLVEGTTGEIQMVRSQDHTGYMLRSRPLVNVLTTEMAPLKKPWVTLFLASDRVKPFVHEHFEHLIDRSAGAIVFLVQMVTARTIKSSSLPIPEGIGANIAGIGFVRAIPEDAVEAALDDNRKIFEAALAAGGTVYPYGSFRLRPEDWPRILRSRFAAFAALKRKYDPNGILNRSFGICEAVERALG